MNNKFNAHILVIIATFLVAGSFIASKKLSGVIDPISLTLFRFIFAALLLSPIIILKRKLRERIIPSFKRTLVISFFYALYFIGLFKALEYTTAINTGTLFTLVPLITGVLSIFIFKQKMSIFQFFIYIVGMIGTIIVIFNGNISLLLSFSLNYGDTIFLFSIVSMAFYSISTKFLYKEEDEVLVLVFMTLIGGCIWMGLALEIFNIPLEWEKIKGDLLIYMVYLTVAATLFTVYLYQKATITLGPKNVMAYVYLNPAAIALLIFLFEETTINLVTLIGILISSFATIILLNEKRSIGSYDKK